LPDLVTHASLTVLAIAAARRARRYLAPALLGSLLPDLLSRPLTMLGPATFDLGRALHAPLVTLAVAGALALAYPPGRRRAVAVAIACGCFAHQAIDLLQHTVDPGYPLLAPFSWRTFPQGPFHTEASLAVMPLLLLLAVVQLLRMVRAPGGGPPGE
jgi:hypothetical protein